MTYFGYLRQPPPRQHLALIAATLGVYLGLGLVLWPRVDIAWWQGWLLAAAGGIAAGLLLGWVFYRRSGPRAGRHDGT